MNPYIMAILICNLAFGAIITAASYHWFLAWIGLELNTLAIIPILAKHHHPRATEAATKYFIIQATASSIILFSSIINAWHTGTWDITQLTTQPTPTMLLIALTMKLGLAPMHFWLPEVMQGADTTTALIVATWQKLPPMSLLYLTSNQFSMTLLSLLAISSTLIGGWSGLNQTQLRKIMAFSSIGHLGWMISISLISQKLLLLTLVIYLMMTTSMFIILITSTTKTTKDLGMIWTISPALSTTTMITLMALGGLPPLTGFIPKWLILKELTTNHLLPLATALALSSLLSLMFYMRLTYVSTLTISPNTSNSPMKWRFKPMKPINPTPMIISTLLLIPITPLIYA
uniref:NADH-ubiquinone oxidoreductase chain 2 n=1 Tax=Podarcis siculus TaxID=65484 RepID=A0A5P8PAL7_PODSI|nr:NADH dehydrogenase subunit 2 [Podarcis siculus]QFR52781.1 NADH dehydrogenase subunit 2 [Podarcis siculus]QFR52794.1 NADH dehydrogenase subunit 2 [Podarcis siculus]QFR52807.1 NADH dehydrogenase subunit 2 [Podarcis siculus]QFR52820.1 NADH dehydrogenase subunit 2 [Podarcis siculus]